MPVFELTIALNDGSLRGPEIRISDWTWPASIVIPLILLALLYTIGLAKTWDGTKRRRMDILLFAAGWISLLAALDSPIHELGEQLFWVHMTQHEILMLVSAPLLVLSRPLVPFLWALPPGWRDHVISVGQSRFFKSMWKAVSAPLSTWLLSAGALWIWHIP